MIFGFLAYGLMSQGLISISCWAFVAFVTALCTQSVIFTFFLKENKVCWINILYIPSLWCLSEFIRNALMGGFSFYISHAQAFCPTMLKLYGYIGCGGMSFCIFLVNTLIYLAIIHRRYRWKLVIAAVMVSFSIFGFGLIKKDHDQRSLIHLRIAVIQANISPWEKADLKNFNQIAQTHLDLTEKAFIESQPDLAIWPETAFPDDLLQSDQWRPVIFAQARHIHADLLLGMAPIIDGKEYNSALLVNAQGQMSGLYHKMFLVPFAENTPLERFGLNWGRGYHFVSGKKAGVLSLSHVPVHFGVVICSESAHPSLVRKMHRAGIGFLVEISNDGWFSDKASYMLHAQAAIMRAVENHLWVIRAANTGFSFAVDPDGNIHEDGNIKLGHQGFGIFDIMI